MCCRPVSVFSRSYWFELEITFCFLSQPTIRGAERSPNLSQDRKTEPADQESAVAPGRAAASLGGTTTSSTTTGAHPGGTSAIRCPCPSLAGDLANSKKVPQRGAASRRDPPKSLRWPSLPARPGTVPQPVPPPAQALLSDVIEEPEPEPEPIQDPLPDIVQYPRQVRFRQEHQEPAAAAAAPIEPEQFHREPASSRI